MFRFSRKLVELQIFRRCYSSHLSQYKELLHIRFFEHVRKNYPKSDPLRLDPNLSSAIENWSKRDSPASVYHDQSAKESWKKFDADCFDIIKRLRYQDSKSQIIHGFVDFLVDEMPEKVQFMKVFSTAMRILFDFFYDKPEKETFVKLCFYLGLMKKRLPGPKLLSNLMDDFLNKMMGSDMSTIDMAIVCTALYKASVRTQRKMFEQRLIKEIVSTEQVDQRIFSTFIKSLRLNKINSPEVYEKLRQLRDRGDLNDLNIEVLMHIFILIADNSIKEDDLTEFFIDRCISTMNSETRAKDVQKILYSCALLSFPVKKEHLLKLEQQVMTRTNHVEYQLKFDNFVDAALSMWMLNHRPRDLVDKLLNDKRFHKTGDESRIKLDSRKKLLLTCVEIEEPTWIQHMEIETPSFDVHRPSPKYLSKTSIENLMKRMRGKKVKLVQQIQHLNIAGILVQEKSGKLLHVEVLDKTNLLSDKKTPNGIIALKLRLLKHMKCKIKVVSAR